MASAVGDYVVRESGVEFRHDPTKSDVEATTSEVFLQRFRDNFEMRVLERPGPNDLVMEFSGVDASFMNALRRILIAEVPTVAIETVYMWENTSLLHDEVLSHRLGLIPIQFDARLLQEFDREENEVTDINTLVFTLEAKCGRKPDKDEEESVDEKSSKTRRRDHHDDDVVQSHRTSSSTRDEDDEEEQQSLEQVVREVAASTKSRRYKYAVPKDRPYTKHVYSGDLKWNPQGNQLERWGGPERSPDAVRPIHDDILIAKLRPGQAIALEAHAFAGIGKDHAKYSPVATASYRLLPRVALAEPVYDDLAEQLVHVYEPGVFKLVPADGGDPKGTRYKAAVCNPYACTMSRNYMRDERLKRAVRMTRDPNHFILSVESVGMYDPAVLVAEALRTLQRKCSRVIALIDDYAKKLDDDNDDEGDVAMDNGQATTTMAANNQRTPPPWAASIEEKEEAEEEQKVAFL